MSILERLRRLRPHRILTEKEELALAELQANHLLDIQGVSVHPVSSSIITELPMIRVEHVTSSLYIDENGNRLAGAARWDSAGRGQILLDAENPSFRRRFTVAHEFKHLIDGTSSVISPGVDITARKRHVLHERICNHFAACVLMPRSLVTAAWQHKRIELHEMAARFRVSRTAMRIRLRRLGLERRNKRRNRQTSVWITTATGMRIPKTMNSRMCIRHMRREFL